MKFIKSEGTEELEAALVAVINTTLATGKPVLWLVPGGSNISVAVRVMDKLDVFNLHRLTILLTDERYGQPGHADSNFYQLHQQHFEERGAMFNDLLQGESLDQTVAMAATQAQKAFESHEEIIGFFGMGPDGHVAGILPNSPAAVKDQTWMIGYDGGQFKRMTLTPYALSHVTKAFVGAFGTEKLTALESLQHTMLPITEQPAQILRHIPDVIIFNDLMGDA